MSGVTAEETATGRRTQRLRARVALRRHTATARVTVHAAGLDARVAAGAVAIGVAVDRGTRVALAAVWGTGECPQLAGSAEPACFGVCL